MVDLLGGVLRALDGDLRDAGEVVEADHVADHEHLGVAGEGEVGVHADAPGTVQRCPRLVGEHLAEGAGLHAGGPDLGHRVDAATGAVLVLDLEAALVDVDDHRTELDLDPEVLQRGLGLLAELRAERRQHLGRGVEQDHPGLPGVDAAEVVLQGPVGELGDLAGHLHTGRAGADDHEGEQAVDLLLVVGDLGELEGAEDPSPQLERVVDRLHAGGELGEVVVAEVGLARPRGDDQRVVGRHRLPVEDVGGDGPVLQVDVGDLAEDHPGVLLRGQDLAGGRCDLALGEDAGRHLVQQRLEEVVGGLGDHGDVDIGAPERLGAEQATEA